MPVLVKSSQTQAGLHEQMVLSTWKDLEAFRKVPAAGLA